jgi:DHA2 family multidrug resistance protein
MTATADTAEAAPLPRHQMRMIAMAIIPCGALQSFDTFAVAIALPTMMGAFSCTITEISWVLTAYLVAAAVFTPLFGWATRRVGRRRLLLFILAGFSVTTAMVATASTLQEVIALRFLQGVFSAGLNPLAQQVIMAAVPKDEHSKAFSWMSAGRMTGVTLGPIIGGLMTENFGWGYVFWFNFPFVVMALVLVWRHVPEGGKVEGVRFDMFGFLCLSVAILFFQLFLDQGERLEWFDSPAIAVFAALAAGAFYLFGIHMFTARNTYIDPRVFANRDFMIGLLFIFINTFLIYGIAGLIPSLLQDHMGYPPLDAAYALSTRGVGSIISSLVTGWILLRMPIRPVLAAGISITGLSTWMLSTIGPEIGLAYVGTATFIQGFGLGIFNVSVTTAAFATISPGMRPYGTTLTSLVRRMSSAIGISVLVAILVHKTQTVRASLTEALHDGRLNKLALPESWNPVEQAGAMRLNSIVDSQAQFIAFLYDFRLMSIVILFCVPMVLLLKPSRQTKAGEAH